MKELFGMNTKKHGDDFTQKDSTIFCTCISSTTNYTNFHELQVCLFYYTKTTRVVGEFLES